MPVNTIDMGDSDVNAEPRKAARKRDTTTLVKLRAKGPQTWEIRFHRPDNWPKHVPADVRRTFHGTAAAARAERQRLERELTDLRALTPAEVRRLKVAPTMEAWVTECLETMRRLKRAPLTVCRRETDWRVHLSGVLTGVRVNEIEPAHMSQILKRVAGLAPATQRGVFASLGTFLSMAKGIHVDVVPDMPRIKKPQYKVDSLPDDDRVRLLAACESLRDRCMFVLGLHGLRRGEIVGVRGEDLSHENGGHVLTVRRAVCIDEQYKRIVKCTKSGKERTIPLTDDGAALLLEYRDTLADPAGWLFPSPYDPDQPVHFRMVEHTLKRVCKAAGVRQRSTHVLRKTCATALAQAGAGEHEIAAHLGHATTAMAAAYVNRSRLRSARIVNGLASLTTTAPRDTSGAMG